MRPAERVEIVIVGAGPVGLVLAGLLADYGVRVLLVGPQPGPVAGLAEDAAVPSVILGAGGLRLLQALGLAQAALRAALVDCGAVLLGPRRRPFATWLPATAPDGWPARSGIQPQILIDLLTAEIGQGAAASLRPAARLLSFEDRGDEVIAVVQDGNERRVVVCDYLVGCDGELARVRRALEIDLARTGREERWLVVDVAGSTDPFRDARLFCDALRPGLNLAGPERTRRFVVRLRHGETAAFIAEEARLRSLIAWFGGAPDVRLERLQLVAQAVRSATQWRRGRVFLAGDEAHCLPELAGVGLESGLRDAANLAWKLAVVVQGRMGDALLDSYEQERRAQFAKEAGRASRFLAIAAPRGRRRAWLWRTALRLARPVPVLRRRLLPHPAAAAPRLRGGFLPAAERGRPRHLLCGSVLPQIRVEVAGGDARRLDELLGPAFACIVYGMDPAASWGRLGAGLPPEFCDQVVGVLPEEVAFPRRPFAPLARDHEGALGRLLGRHAADKAGALILLRPDRVVLAVVTLARAGQVQGALRALLAASFREPVAVRLR